MTYLNPAHAKRHRVVPRFNRRELATIDALRELGWKDRANLVRDAVMKEIAEAIEQGLISQEEIDYFELEIIRLEESKKPQVSASCNIVPIPTPANK